jgi:hypothetical protein
MRWHLCSTARQVRGRQHAGTCYLVRSPLVCWLVARCCTHTHTQTHTPSLLSLPLPLTNTTETNNEVNREEAAKGEPDQYLHIHTIQGVVCPSLETLQLLNTLHCETRDNLPEPPKLSLCSTQTASVRATPHACPSCAPAPPQLRH